MLPQDRSKFCQRDLSWNRRLLCASSTGTMNGIRIRPAYCCDKMSKTKRGITLTPRAHHPLIFNPHYIVGLPPLLSLCCFALRLSLSFFRPCSVPLAHALSLALSLALALEGTFVDLALARRALHTETRAHQWWCAWTCACVYTRKN
jgi:hypothetical protein